MSHMRALRLEVAVPVLEAMDDFSAGLYPEPQPYVGIVTQALVSTASIEDLQLARACVDAERDIRRREWAGLERLLGAIPPGGDLDDIFDLPSQEQIAALRGAIACRWFWPGAEEA
jgi:hypothetical protein